MDNMTEERFQEISKILNNLYQRNSSDNLEMLKEMIIESFGQRYPEEIASIETFKEENKEILEDFFSDEISGEKITLEEYIKWKYVFTKRCAEEVGLI